MDWKTRFFTAILLLFTIWLGWKYFTRPDQLALAPTPTPSLAPTPEPTRAPATAEDIAQLLAVPVVVTNSKMATTSGTLGFALENKVGFVTLFGDAIATPAATQVIEQIDRYGAPNTWVAVDQEGGIVQRLSGAGFTRQPSLQEVCTYSPEQRAATFATSAAELSKVGIDVVFAPVVDLASGSGVLKSRTCSTDQIFTTAVAQEAIAAYQQQQIMPVIKHYPGIGLTKVDLHKELDAVYQEPPELQVFKTILQLHPKIGVMTTFVLVAGLSENAPCTFDFNCIVNVTGYSKQALIFTDALEMKSALTGTDLVSEKSLVQVSREALLAGNHVLVYGRGITAAELTEILNTLVAEYGTNEVLREKIDRALIQIETHKLELKTATIDQGN